MGFDIHLQCFRNGRTTPFPRKVAENIFDPGAAFPSNMQYVEYPDGRGEIYCGSDDDTTTSGFMLAHFGGHTICARLLEIAAVTQSLIFWASNDVMFAVTDLAHKVHLPEDVQINQYVALVRNVDELWSAINAELAPSTSTAWQSAF